MAKDVASSRQQGQVDNGAAIPFFSWPSVQSFLVYAMHGLLRKPLHFRMAEVAQQCMQESVLNASFARADDGGLRPAVEVIAGSARWRTEALGHRQI